MRLLIVIFANFTIGIATVVIASAVGLPAVQLKTGATEVVQLAQSDENEEGEDQLVPNVSPKFLTKLLAITESASSPDQKLADIDALVRSYGWPSTPPAIAQVVSAAREHILAQKAADTQNAGAQVSDTEKESEELGLFLQFSVRFYIAKYCANNDAYFTADEVDRLQLALQQTFASMSLSQQKKDAAWQNVQARIPAQLAGMTEEECAAEKRSYALLWPQVFAPNVQMDNPF